jgi:multidrug resistance efflux pump
MLELMLSCLVTLVPDILYRRYAQGKRLGHEITFFNVWYELRWGISCCAVLAISLITLIFYFHPTSDKITSFFRTVTILSESGGRVAEVYVSNHARVAEGDPLFRLDTSRQEAAAETARRQIAEVDAALLLGATEIAGAQAQLDASEAQLTQARDDLQRRQSIAERNSTVVTEQELEQLSNAVDVAEGQRNAAIAAVQAATLRVSDTLPAQRDSAEAALAQAETEIAFSTVYAGVSGTVTQFQLKPGDVINPILRPAGVLVADMAGPRRFMAGFRQISAGIVKEGMLIEMTCPAKPLTVIPMRVVQVQDTIAAGQFRPGDNLIDIQDRIRPGTLLTIMEPIFPEKVEGVPPGSRCTGVGFTDHSKFIEENGLTGLHAFMYKAIDGLGVTNAVVIRAMAIVIPVKALVFN